MRHGLVKLIPSRTSVLMTKSAAGLRISIRNQTRTENIVRQQGGCFASASPSILDKKSSRPPLWPPAIFIFYTSLELVLFKSLVEPNKRVRQIIQGYSPPYKRPVLGYLGGGKSAAHHWKLESFTLCKRTRSANW